VEMANVKDQATSKAENIIAVVAHKILKWKRISSEKDGIVIHPTRLEARSLYGIAPDHASISLDVYFKQKDQAEALEADIRKVARKGSAGKLQVRIVKGAYRPPLPERESTQAFFSRVEAIAHRLETKTAPIYRTISSAACYVPDDIPVLEGLGPAGGNSRSPNEFIFRDSLIDRATLLALVIRESGKAHRAKTTESRAKTS